MVTRKAIIIGSPGGYRSLHTLKGVKKDLENYKSFLKSKAGGEWSDNEIEVLDDPDHNHLLKEINGSLADYTFIVFSGHGYINTYTSEDTVCLKDIDLSIGKLVSPSNKQTIVIDACRQHHAPTQEALTEELRAAFSAEIGERSTREIFDKAITETPTGILLVFGTQAKATAGDDENKGGYFNYSFLRAGRDWWKNGNGVLKLDKAVEKAAQIMKTIFLTNQKPEMAGQIRRITFPPFAIANR